MYDWRECLKGIFELMYIVYMDSRMGTIAHVELYP